ncbi:MAG TPA: amidohydrolase family protein [Vicinamibacterales bacterium]|jgi:imidazolonepropionase-like amidohydrolase|nr:amidohydrolase family protein [Vicinamibacterales bacterium]
MLSRTSSLLVVGIAAAVVASPHADAPFAYAIRGARIVTAAGAPIASGTIVLRGGLVESIGADVAVPGDARVVDGAGLTVYPGLIDMGTAAGIELPRAGSQEFKTTEEAERYKRDQILRPQLEAAEHIRPDAPGLTSLASVGITSVLATPSGEVVKGRSALVNVTAPEEDPQIGAVADARSGLVILRAPVALHVEFTERPRGDGYPASLMGVIAFVRQAFLDGQHHQAAADQYQRVKAGVTRPVFNPALDALQPALAGKMPVAFEADTTREILRALKMAAEFKLDPIVTGAREADQVAADLKARNARVILSLNYPTRPRTLAPDADESVRALRDRSAAPKTAAALEKAGILFAFESDGLKESKDFVKNAARAVKDGLAPDAAVRALTINAARIAGAGERLGSLEKGKIANVLVMEGDLFDEKAKVKHVFIDGRPVNIEPPAAAPPARRTTQ